MNWISTTVPLWQIDCEAFRRAKKPFELRDVTTDEHIQFVIVLSARYEMKTTRVGNTVRFEAEG